MLDKFPALTEKELQDMNGGAWPLVLLVVGYLAWDAWSHSDQIIKGWNDARR
jgi:hypothetical protein